MQALIEVKKFPIIVSSINKSTHKKFDELINWDLKKKTNNKIQNQIDLINCSRLDELVSTIHRTNADPVSLIFWELSDEINGDEIGLLKKITNDYSDVEIVIFSNVSFKVFDEILNNLDEVDNVALLQKPYDQIIIYQMIMSSMARWEKKRYLKNYILDLQNEVNLNVAKTTKAQIRTENIRNQMELILDSTNQGVYGLDREDNITFINFSGANMLGWEKDDLIEKNHQEYFVNFISKEAQKLLCDHSTICQSIEKCGSYYFDIAILKRKDGTQFEAELFCNPIIEKENIVGASIVFHDITEQEKIKETVKITNEELNKKNKELIETQGQLIQSAKLASIGELATGVAHELNQPLAYIRGNAQMEVMGGKEEFNAETAFETLELVIEGTDRMISIINHLREFSRQAEEVSFELIDIHEVIENSFILIKTQLQNRNITVEKNYMEDAPTVRGNQHTLEQVFVNLLTNARDVLKNHENGKITITTKTENLQLIVTFSDNGNGVNEEDIHKIFDPFFTTKEIGEGTGLGLSISYGIIQKHNGTIEVSNSSEGGALFTIGLPIAE